MNRRTFLNGLTYLGGTALLASCNKNGATEVSDDITSLSALELSKAIKSQQLNCVEVMEAYLKRIHRYNPTYNAIVSMLDDDTLIARAKEADVALSRGDYWGWMHGMPHAVKDLADAEGLETSYGSPIFAGNIAKHDSLPIARIRAQGAIFIGKTNAPEFGLGSQSYNPVHGTTGSAYDPSLTAGGSSGGAAAALGLHFVPCADGSDMMGSLRNPAGYNNVVGFRPSQGRVPSPSEQSELFYDQLATDGPMGRNVEDTIQLLHTMAGHDFRAPLSLRDGIPPLSEFQAADLSKLKIGWFGDYDGYLPMEDGVLDLCQSALNVLSQNGAIVEHCQPDYDMPRLWETWLTLRHWSMTALSPLYENDDTKTLLKPELIWEIEGGLKLTATDIAAAGKNRSDWFRALHKMFQKYDFLALPTAQVFPFPADIHWPKSINGTEMDTYHRWMEVVIGGTLSGLPVVNLPAGFDERGRPMGIQFAGPTGADKKVLEFALSYQAVLDFLDRRPVLVS